MVRRRDLIRILASKIEKETSPSDVVNYALLREVRKNLGWP